MTPLGERLVRLIAASGPIGVGDFMAACLFDPQHGYYTTREPFGREGDFITAPEISQMFGELIGVWCAVSTWGLFGFSWATSWPLLVIGIGLLFVVEALWRNGRSEEVENDR